MDFDDLLSMASQNQGLSSIPKRYSLKTGPPKKDPKVKGVNSAAVQAFLQKQELLHKKKELDHKKQKEELLAKRVELKSDRKARAMASRTKDNFKGYNGIPIVDKPKRRLSKGERPDGEFGNSYEDDEDNYEYTATDSESEPELEPVRSHSRTQVQSNVPGKTKKPSGPPKPPPPAMNFADLLKLAEKKQFEPVELKTTKKMEEKLHTAEELRELELERRAKKQDKGKDVKQERHTAQKDGRSQFNANSSKKSLTERDSREGKSHRASAEKVSSSGASKKPKPHVTNERPHSSAKLSQGDRPRASSSSTSALNGKTGVKGGTRVSAKQPAPRSSSGQRPPTTSDLNPRKANSTLPHGRSSTSGVRPGIAPNSSANRQSGPMQGHHKDSGTVRSSQGNSERAVLATHSKSGRGEPIRTGGNASSRPLSNGPSRPVPGGPSKHKGMPQPRPGSSLQGRPGPKEVRAPMGGPSRPVGGVPSKSMNGMGSGPGRPKCTVVSETISLKNFAPKPGMGPRPPGHQPMMRPPGPMLPPITSSYKRKYEEELDEYDSEMDDFIDDEGEDQNEISKHIKAIFGYDRTRYKEESDYALRFMESSWRDQQKEEARSLKLAVIEDQEEERREEEELRRNMAKSLRLGIKEDAEEMRLEEEEMKKKLVLKTKRKKL